MARYLRFVLFNKEPFRIADESTSQSGDMSTLTYIPGSTIRGVVISRLAKSEEFEKRKAELLSDRVQFLNAYVTVHTEDGFHALQPTPKGFYEDRVNAEVRKEIFNVVVDDVDPGLKRASMGKYAFIKGDTIHHFSVKVDSEMKNTVNVDEMTSKNNGMDKGSPLFRNEYVKAGYRFEGHIRVEDESLESLIEEALPKEFIIGNARSTGLGKCMVVEKGWLDEQTYNGGLPERDQEGSCYIMLTSDMVMRDESGQPCGLNICELEKLLQVDNLSIDRASTSVREVRGYNRIWRSKIPAITMYEKGSVFKLTYEGTVSVETMKNITGTGLGIRKNEGYGRVVFLDKYEDIKYKIKGIQTPPKIYDATGEKEDDRVIRQIAETLYRKQIYSAIRQQIVKGNIFDKETSRSQLGTLESIAVSSRYDPEKGKNAILAFINHEEEKNSKNRTNADKNSIVFLRFMVEDKKLTVREILEKDLREILSMRDKENIMGIPTCELLSEEELERIKLEYISQSIRYAYKGGDKNGQE